MLRQIARAVVLGLLVLVCTSPCGFAQEAAPSTQTPAERPANNDPDAKPVEDGHDRPTTYPRIRFGGTGPEVREPGGEARKRKARVYLLDVSDAMAASISMDNAEVTRLERMVSEMSKSLDSLAKRRDLCFNVVTFGKVQDLAGGGEPWLSTPDNVQKARDWVKKLQSGGAGDLHAMLKACFEQMPESATLMVGGLPGTPEGVAAEELARHASAGEYIIAKVKEWRAAGKNTTLDITGIGLSEAERDYYKRLAQAAGGTYLDS
ncbi:MAG: hypothetical protein IT463_08785 [Planctomycetes bacterium]|nr:hypothetical protein [Planctomycetota bacterium]